MRIRVLFNNEAKDGFRSGWGFSCLIGNKNNILFDTGGEGPGLLYNMKKMKLNAGDIEAIVLSHEHHDHIQGVGVMSRRCSIPVFANQGTFRGAEKRLKKLHARNEFNTGDVVDFQDMQVRSFAVSHDTYDPVGFVIGDGKNTVGYCTDTGIVSTLIGNRLRGLDSVILEFNHDPDLLKNGPYPPSLQQRVRSNQGHLANGESAKLLEKIVHAGLQQVILAHLSETNNLPEIAYREAEAVIPDSVSNKILSVSEQDHPSPLFNIV